jgi:hypothetical protein
MHNLLTGAVSQLQPGHDEPVTALGRVSDIGECAYDVA